LLSKSIIIPKPTELEDYFNFLFSGLDGFMYIVAKVPDQPESWDQLFLEYPEQVPTAVEAINKYSSSHEIYVSPALYSHKRAVKETFKVSQVLWCDFDGNTPAKFDIPPSLSIRSSEEGHNHTYWRLDTPITDPTLLEDYNRRLTFKYEADASGWDATQVLRPPYTVNHKRGKLNVYTEVSNTSTEFNLGVFDTLAPAPAATVDFGLWDKIDLPDLNDVIYAHRFGPEFRMSFEKQKEEVGDRSSALTAMSFICAEAGLNDKEIYVVISHLATRWEKFKHHTASSRARQLLGIIEHTRIKYPNSNFNSLDTVFEYSPKSLIDTDISIDWAIPGLLMQAGNMLLAGPSGIGKSQLSMQFMAHIAMGKDFLGFKIDEPKKVGFLSLEMGDIEVKHLIELMYPQWEELYTKDDIGLLNENLKILPFGESLALNSSNGQDVMLQYQEQNNWEGIFVDSVGSAILGNINDSATVQPFTNFNDKLRKRYGCFLWYIHHFRKPPPGTKNYGGQEDVYGDQYLSAKSTTILTLTKAKHGLLRIRNPKNRHSPELEDFLIHREEGLFFTNQGDEAPEPAGGLEAIVQKATGPAMDASPKPFGI
jgi:hypothetical protein